jgi:large repetitive protein
MPADIQTTSGGGPRGKPWAGDAVVFTFASPPDPSLILAGWDGSATTVTLRITDNGKNDILTILNVAALGSVQLGGDYVDKKTVNVPGSTMTLAGNVLKVVLGAPSVQSFAQQKTGTMIWTTPSGAATESGPADNEF